MTDDVRLFTVRLEDQLASDVTQQTQTHNNLPWSAFLCNQPAIKHTHTFLDIQSKYINSLD